jgi:trigger factor
VAKIELVDISVCKKNLIIEIPADVAQKELDELSREFARRARVPGFRPGKTPLSIIKKRFQAEIREQFIRKVVPQHYQEAIKEKQLKPISDPYLEKSDFLENGAFSFQTSLEVLPPLQIEGYKDLKSTVVLAAITPEGVQQALETIQERHAKFLPIEDRASRLGDFVAVNLKGKLTDGSNIEFQDKNVNIELGRADTITGFTENLTGLIAGDTRVFTVTYSDDFENPRLAGKGVEYQAEVVAIKEKRLPEIDDELAKEVGEFANLQELRQFLTQKLEGQAKNQYEKNVRTDLMNQLLAKNEFEAPESLVEAEVKDALQRIAEEMARQGIDVSRARFDWKAAAQENRPKAVEAVRRKLALGAIAEQESIFVTDEELEAEIRKLADATQRTPDAMRAALSKDNRLEELRLGLRRQKAMELICQYASA